MIEIIRPEDLRHIIETNYAKIQSELKVLKYFSTFTSTLAIFEWIYSNMPQLYLDIGIDHRYYVELYSANTAIRIWIYLSTIDVGVEPPANVQGFDLANFIAILTGTGIVSDLNGDAVNPRIAHALQLLYQEAQNDSNSGSGTIP